MRGEVSLSGKEAMSALSFNPPFLDLASANCLEFTVTGILEEIMPVPDESANQIKERMQETDCQEAEPAGGTMAHYGSVYTEGDSVLVCAGGLLSVTGDEGTKFSPTILFRLTNDQPVPPSSFQPFSELLEVMAPLDAVRFVCDAEYNYDLGPNLQSRIELPAPLLLGRPDDYYGFTHIESATLSQRTAGEVEHGEVEHRVTVMRNGDQISHSVTFMVDLPVTQENLRSVFDISTQLSKSLLYSGDES